MTPAKSTEDLEAAMLLRSIKEEQSAKDTLERSNLTGLRTWEIPMALGLGVMTGLLILFAGQSIVSAVAVGLGFAALNLALACAAETRRLNRRLNAVLKLQDAQIQRKNTLAQ